ncbi:MAG: Trm112 family protein [Actinobacteria bacterium]|nr:Trm112 family protein [Actinomycetota bacterium]
MANKQKVDDQLIQLLICPNCRGEIEYREQEDLIVCVGECKYEYPVVDGIPHMLIEEAKKP